MEIVYTTEACGKTYLSVAREFGESFPERRKIRRVGATNDFKLVGGRRTYRIGYYHQEGCYRIFVLKEG